MTTRATHTEGPWHWEGDSFDGEPQACPHGTKWTDHGPVLLGKDDQGIIRAYGYDASGLSINAANAALIAAAPALLSAAVEATAVTRVTEDGDGMIVSVSAFKALLEAVAGATGGQA